MLQQLVNLPRRHLSNKGHAWYLLVRPSEGIWLQQSLNLTFQAFPSKALEAKTPPGRSHSPNDYIL